MPKIIPQQISAVKIKDPNIDKYNKDVLVTMYSIYGNVLSSFENWNITKTTLFVEKYVY